MAADVTVVPTLGHAVLVTQEGVGDSPGYDALDLRRMLEGGAGVQAGVFQEGAWEVSQNAGGAAMSVTVAADLGIARVDGTTIDHQGPYVVAPHEEAITVDATAADATHPRIDLVCLQVRDDAVDSSGANDARVRMIAGTPTAGADLENLDGQAALPDNALLLADVRVASGAAAILDAAIADRRVMATVAGEGGGGIGVVPLVNTLPSTPDDGDEVFYQAADMATSGVVWHLRYRADSPHTHKWEFIGGSRFEAIPVDYPAEGTTLGTYTALTTPGPALYAPIAGTYAIEWGVEFMNAYGLAGIETPGVAASDATAIGGATYSTADRRLVRDLAASGLVRLMYRAQTAGQTAQFLNRRLSLTPIRVG